MTIVSAFDIGLVVLILGIGASTIATRGAFAAVIGFVVYGLLLSIAWVRLSAVDVALTEAAIGGGMTGMLMLGAVARLRQDPPAGAVDVVDAPEVEDHHEGALAEAGLDAVRQVLRGAEEEGAVELEHDDAPALPGEELHQRRRARPMRAHHIAPVATADHRAAHAQQEQRDEQGDPHHIHEVPEVRHRLGGVMGAVLGPLLGLRAAG